MCSSYRFFSVSLIASFIGLSICLNHIRVLMVNKSHHVIVYCVQFKDDFVAHQFLFWMRCTSDSAGAMGPALAFCIFVSVYLYLYFCIYLLIFQFILYFCFCICSHQTVRVVMWASPCFLSSDQNCSQTSFAPHAVVTWTPFDIGLFSSSAHSIGPPSLGPIFVGLCSR